MNRRQFLGMGTASLLPIEFLAGCGGIKRISTDVCVYGGNASGVMAAVSAAKEGCRVFIIEPSRWLGGMTGGGLMHIDWGQKDAVGGMTRSVLNDDHDDATYRKIFQELVRKYSIPVFFEHRVESVQKVEGRIESITLEYAPPDKLGCPIGRARRSEAVRVTAPIFIDCSYEGDLMAKSGVAYTYGREAAEEYGESLGGVAQNMAEYEIDPYVTPGDRRSGYLPLLQDRVMGPLGSADKLTMGYGFRWKFAEGEGSLPIGTLEDYDPRMFEVYRRAFQGKVNLAGARIRKLGSREPEQGHMYAMGSGNLSRSILAPAVFGSNQGYPNGDWEERAKIWKFHQVFLGGMTHFLRVDSSARADLKEKAKTIGFQRGSFDETQGWPHQLYVREARRMISRYVVTQKDLEGKSDPSDSVALASYGVDDWPYAMFPLNGKIALNGGMYSRVCLNEANRGIYKIPYRAITPRKEECENLIVPVCCSASHVAMTSIRMEPVWMMLGESAGVAASMAIQERSAVQEIGDVALREKLKERGQILERPT